MRKALSTLHTQLASSLEGTDDGMPAAAAHLRSAVQEDPQNEQAAAQLRQIGERCKDLYLKGYVAKDEASVYEGGRTKRWLKVKQEGWTIGDERWTRRITVSAQPAR